MRSRQGVLGCGLVGFAPMKKGQANLDWIKLMLSFNASRGTDSCGIFMNDEIVKGTGDVADVTKWLAKNKLVYDHKIKNKAILAHMRRASYNHSTKDAFSAHPFQFEHEGRSIIGVHNGGIENYNSLIVNYDVEDKGLTVDSQRLFKIMIEKGYDVLNDYTGNAALLWCFSDDPGAVYCFKGASKLNYHQAYLDDERPLFLMQNSDGTYFSSMREPLDIACDQDLKILSPRQNTVCRIKDNEITAVFEADRTETNCMWTPAKSASNYGKVPTYEIYNEEEEEEETRDRLGLADYWRKIENQSSRTQGKTIPIDSNLRNCPITNPMDFYREKTYSQFDSQQYAKNMVYMLGGRYYCFPSTPGVYTANMHGIDDRKHACPALGIDDYLLNGVKYIKRMTDILFEVMPDHMNVAMWAGKTPYLKKTFFRGVMIDDKMVGKFERKNQAKKFAVLWDKNCFEYLKQISSYSSYPITFSFEEAKSVLKKCKPSALEFYFGGKALRESKLWTPLYTNRLYVVGPRGVISGIRTPNLLDSILMPVDDFLDDIEIVDEEEIEEVDYEMVESEEVRELLLIDDYMICRRVHVSKAIEEALQLDESENGLSEANYYIKWADGLPENIENFTISGALLLEKAMEEYFRESKTTNIDEAAIPTAAKSLLARIEERKVGIINYMNEILQFDFYKTLYEVMSEEFDESVELANAEMMEEDEAGRQAVLDFQMPGGAKELSFKTKEKDVDAERMDADQLEEREWAELFAKRNGLN